MECYAFGVGIETRKSMPAMSLRLNLVALAPAVWSWRWRLQFELKAF